jgi:hypothetical protein
MLMQVILKYIDLLWNLKFIKGRRTKTARAVLALVAAYQWASTAKEITAIVNLPDVSPAIAGAVVGYIAITIEKFAKEHE